MRHAWVVLVACSLSSVQPVRPQAGDALEPGKPIARSIAVGQAHRYRVRLAAHQVLVATVEQKGVDVVVRTFDHDGKQLGESDSPNGTMGPEPVVIHARVPGEYAFEIAPFAAPNASAAVPMDGATYEVRVDEIVSTTIYEERRMKREIDSPFIFALWQSARDGKALPPLRSPVVEPIADDAATLLVTFAFRSTSPYVGMFGGPDWNEKPMQRIAGTDIWFLTARMPADARAGYAFLEAAGPPAYESPFRFHGDVADERYRSKRLDPLNTKTLLDMSLLELPRAPAAPFVDATPPAEGTLAPRVLESRELREQRRTMIYTPPGYDPKQRYPLVIVFDGEVAGIEPGPLLPVARILDNLIAQKKIPPTVAVLVANQGTRNRDLTASPAFAKFVATELVPRLRADFNAGHDAAKTVVAGASYGGLCAAYIALQHSDVVGNALSQSGAFGYRVGQTERALPSTLEPGWLTRQYVAAPKRPIRFYLDAGRFERGGPWSLLDDNRRFRDVLEAKGYSVTYAEFSGGHEYAWWRITLADGLVALLH